MANHHGRAGSAATPHSDTPGLHFDTQVPPLNNSYTPVQHNEPLSPSESLDLTTARNTYDTYDDWTELRDLSSQSRQNSDAQKLLEPRVRRSSTSSSTFSLSSSDTIRQRWPIRWLNSIGHGIARFCTFPVIRHILWPFQWFDRAITHFMRRTRFQGWRMGIILGCCMSTLVLGVNVTVLVTGATRGKGFQNGFAVPMSGLAEEMSWWSSAIHIGINALSTILLAASNYTMQVLSSPTRKDINKAHTKHEHLDIGVLSMRNLGRIPRRRLVLFILMGLSSIPIHLFYNSAVFYIGANNEYNLSVVEIGSENYLSKYESAQAGITYDRLQGSKWISTYDTSLVSYGDLVLAVDEYRTEINNDTLTGKPEKWPEVNTDVADNWQQGALSFNMSTQLDAGTGSRGFVQNITATASTSREWIRLDKLLELVPFNETRPQTRIFAHVSHAYAERLDTASRIQLSLTFLIIVVTCNSVKLLTMLWVVFMERKDYIVTLGDGAASFLETPDPATERMCILSKPEMIREITDAPHKHYHNDQLSRLVTQSGKRWIKQYSTYSNALNRDREVGSYFIFIIVGVLFALFLTTITFLGKASTKWGTQSDNTFREADSSAEQTLLNAWIANAPQLVLSFCYLAINSECTAMAGAAEWNSLASSHKGLRVTKPAGRQRDTYFLQLPYRWSLPLTIVSGGLHWLLSQSIFLVRIDTYDRDGNLIIGDESKSACGFSGTSWIVMTICFWLLVSTVGLIGRKKIRVNIPFAASCSLVISAACHPSREDPDAHLKEVRWGVIKEKVYDGEAHCSLSSRKVKKPEVGEKYL